MKRALLTAAMIISSACTAQEPGGDDLGGGSGVGGIVPGGGLAGAGAGAGGGTSAAGGAGSVASPPGNNGGGGAGAASADGGGTGGSAGMVAGGAGGAAGSAIGGAGGAAGSMGTAGAAGAGGGTAAGTVTITFTTVSYDGEYAPGNYGAVWFEKADGTFIKTAKRWAGATHATDLVAWTAASGGWGSVFFPANMEDMMDAVSSATIKTHEMHTVTWNMMDATPALVPDGELVAVLEMSESRARDRNGPLLKIPFTKGASPVMAMPPDQEGFSGVTLSYQP